jgi:hypothetical protein
MKKSFRFRSAALTGICLCLVVAFGFTQTHTMDPAAPQKERAVPSHAVGGLDVKLTPEALADKAADANLGRMSIDKQFHGDLEGSSKGEMLTASTSVTGSGVYVAIERVGGTLQGRTGSFALHHTGVMTRGTPELRITVVPDSGTDQLVASRAR